MSFWSSRGRIEGAQLSFGDSCSKISAAFRHVHFICMAAGNPRDPVSDAFLDVHARSPLFENVPAWQSPVDEAAMPDKLAGPETENPQAFHVSLQVFSANVDSCRRSS